MRKQKSERTEERRYQGRAEEKPDNRKRKNTAMKNNTESVKGGAGTIGKTNKRVGLKRLVTGRWVTCRRAVSDEGNSSGPH